MKKIRKIIAILFLLCLIITSFAVAHPGGLDSNGGHYNRKTGEYHYHSGEHTESNYSGSLKINDYDYEDNYVPPQPQKKIEQTNETSLFIRIILILLCCVFGFSVIIPIILFSFSLIKNLYYSLCDFVERIKNKLSR